MINLLPEEQENLQKWDRVKKLVTKVTTWVLVVYVLGAVGVVGWAVFLGSREGSVSEEVKNEERKLVELARVETLMRQLENRVEVVDQALGAERVVDKLKLVNQPDVRISTWTFAAGGTQTLGVAGNSAGILETYVDKLKQSYPNLEVGSVARQENGSWTMTLVIK